MPTTDAYVRAAAPAGELALTGPSAKAPAGHLPVRGDLAHVRLAGVHFVPHYAVPMAHRVTAANGASLHAAGRDEAPVLGEVAADATFNVLDIAGGWAWGQVGEDGLVGYLPLAVLEAA